MKARYWIIGLALVLGSGAGGVALAHGMMGGGMHGGMMGGGGMAAQCPMMGGQQMMPMQDMGMGMGMPHGSMMRGMADRLDLDDAQSDAMRQLRSEHRRTHMARMADIMDLKDEMHALMAGDRPDPDAVQALHGRIAELHGEMLADGVRMRNSLRDLLTEEQRAQMQEQMSTMPEHRRGGRHQMMNR